MIALKPSPLTATLSLNARLQAATEALLKTRDQVVQALDQHLTELDTLRRALSTSEKTPQPVSHFDGLPSGPLQPPTSAPLNFERHSPAPVSTIPLMTQVLWPSKQQQEQPVAPQRPQIPTQVTAPRPSASPVSSPMVAYTSLPNPSAQQNTVDPDLEKATLEELNAALAYAFSHVSHARTVPNGFSSPI